MWKHHSLLNLRIRSWSNLLKRCIGGWSWYTLVVELLIRSLSDLLSWFPGNCWPFGIKPLEYHIDLRRANQEPPHSSHPLQSFGVPYNHHGFHNVQMKDVFKTMSNPWPNMTLHDIIWKTWDKEVWIVDSGKLLRKYLKGGGHGHTSFGYSLMALVSSTNLLSHPSHKNLLSSSLDMSSAILNNPWSLNFKGRPNSQMIEKQIDKMKKNSSYIQIHEDARWLIEGVWVLKSRLKWQKANEYLYTSKWTTKWINGKRSNIQCATEIFCKGFG